VAEAATSRSRTPCSTSCTWTAYFLEYDDTRSGTFEPLRFVPGQDRVLGLLTTKTAELEPVDLISAVSMRRPGTYRSSAVPEPAVRLREHSARQSDHRGGSVAKLTRILDVTRQVWGPPPSDWGAVRASPPRRRRRFRSRFLFRAVRQSLRQHRDAVDGSAAIGRPCASVLTAP